MRPHLFSLATPGDTLGDQTALLSPELADSIVEAHILDHRVRLEYNRIGAANPRDGAANDRWRMSGEPAYREAERAKIRSNAERLEFRRELIEAGGLRPQWIATAEVNRFDVVSA